MDRDMIPMYVSAIASQATQLNQVIAFYNVPGELRLSGNHTVMEYEMSGEPYSQRSGWIIHSNERIFLVMTFK